MQYNIEKVKEDKGFTSIGASIAKKEVQVTRIEITDDKTFNKAIEIVKQIKVGYKKIEDQRKEYVFGASKFVKDVNDLHKPYSSRLKNLETLLKAKIIAYQDKLEEAARKEQARIDEINRKKEEAHQKKIDEGKKVKDVVLEDKAPEPVTHVKTKKASVVFSTVTDWEVENKEDIPKHYLVPNNALITKAIRGGVLEIPGIKIFTKKVSRIA